MYELLNSIHSPQELKQIDGADIPRLNEEIRAFLVENVTKTGGHLASNLGVVELTVAIHRVFDCPRDHILFDVGHQSYVHKILTGRREAFDTLRRENGLSGFTKPAESEYDCFGAGHSSTSISAALGFAEADRLKGSDAFTVAVVGDGAFTGGMIYEALNNCNKNQRLILILNENEMSISPNVGNLSKHISRIRATKGYLRFKRGMSRFLDYIPLLGQPLKRLSVFAKTKLKSAVYNLNIFENMGIRYLGPIDGNDYYSVETMLREAKRYNSCVLVHMKTQKGCGYRDAVENPEKYHGISSSDSVRCDKSFSEVAGETLCRLGAEVPTLCAITAAMSGGTGLEPFRHAFPERHFDVGIAEAHAVTFFAGLSAAGMKPVFAVYSTFLQRAYDSLLHDVSLQSLGGLLLIDRAGFATEDGATHHGIFDVAFLSQVRGLTLYEPIDFATFERMIGRALSENTLFAVRYPKGGESETLTQAFGEATALSDTDEFGIRCVGLGADGTLPENVIVSYGRITAEALACRAALSDKHVDCGIVLLQTLKPLEKQAERIASVLPKKGGKVAFLEEGIYEGGVALLLHEALDEIGALSEVESRIFAIRGEIPEQGTLENLYRKCGVSRDDLIRFFAE